MVVGFQIVLVMFVVELRDEGGVYLREGGGGIQCVCGYSMCR